MQDGHILEAQRGAGGNTDFSVKVKGKALSGHLPRWHPAAFVVTFAGGVSGLIGDEMFVANENYFCGLPIATTQKTVVRLRERPLKGVYLQRQRWPPEQIARIADAHIAARLHQVVGLEVFELVSTQGGLAAP